LASYRWGAFEFDVNTKGAKMRTIITAALFVSFVCTGFAQSQSELQKRIDRLEERVAKLEAAIGKQEFRQEAAETKEQIAAGERAKAKARMRKDLEVYAADDLRQIERLYQVANKEWRSEEGKKSLKELIARYDKANRTGCALLYLGQMTKGDEQIDYLTQAIRSYGVCYYGDGAQVGAYARFFLAWRYKQEGKADKAKALFDEVTTLFPNAIDHRGNLFSEIIAKENKSR